MTNYYYEQCWVLDQYGRWILMSVPVGRLTTANTSDIVFGEEEK
jgi:hypothetical protein